MANKPALINFQKIGTSSEGFISIGEQQKQIPFDVKRIFWTYYTPDNIVRGRHAHHQTEMVLIAAAGRIVVTTQMPGEGIETHVLEHPEIGLYLPKLCWHTMQYSHNAVQLVFTSTFYEASDYIRSYDDFKAIKSVDHG